MNSDKACRATMLMWERIAKTADKRAREFAEKGSDRSALCWAKIADACYWQSTGEGDAITMNDV